MKKIILPKKLLFFKTFPWTSRMHFWQLHLRLSTENWCFSGQKKLRELIISELILWTRRKQFGQPRPNFLTLNWRILFNVEKQTQSKSLSPNFSIGYVECSFQNSAKTDLTKSECFSLSVRIYLNNKTVSRKSFLSN